MNKKVIRLIITIIVLIVGYLSQVSSPQSTDQLTPATISKHIDGDTFVVEVDGSQETVRLIGIDTPEKDGPYTEEEPFGQEASNFTAQALPLGTTVYLQIDESDRDTHDRLLRYVWLSPVEDLSDPDSIREQMFNAILIDKGYAEAKTYKPDVAYQQIFDDLEEEAKANKLGMYQ
ncbi:thermonuclease family protein [Clostridia bacterium]|nr:thermonuclease family protein [Clostridia bacterium]